MNYACGHCGRHHESIADVRECSIKNPGDHRNKTPWELSSYGAGYKGRRRRNRPELNIDTCPACKAEGGKPCFSKRTGKVLFLTHSTYKKRNAQAKDRPMALDPRLDS